MAHWQLGDKDQARRWYEQAIAWMDKKNPQNEELRRFRDEAAILIHPTKQPVLAVQLPTTAPFHKAVEPVAK